MYGLQTAPSSTRTNCKIQRNIGNQHLDCSSIKETIFFGVILDENLNWQSEISHVANKVAKELGIIFKYRFFLPKTSLTYPHFHEAFARYTRLSREC